MRLISWTLRSGSEQILYNVQLACGGAFKCKIPYLSGVLQCKGVNFLNSSPMVKINCSRFPPAVGPTPLPHIPRHVIQFQIGRRRLLHKGNLLGLIRIQIQPNVAGPYRSRCATLMKSDTSWCLTYGPNEVLGVVNSSGSGYAATSRPMGLINYLQMIIQLLMAHSAEQIKEILLSLLLVGDSPPPALGG
jgi:hypothetical protein